MSVPEQSRARITIHGAVVVVLMTALFACAGADTSNFPKSSRLDSAVPVAAIDSGAAKLEPRDEANESFREFRARTLDALARKDTTYLYEILAPEIKNTFGGDDGVEGFKRVWNMNDAAASEVWTALARVLNMGGQQPTDSSFISPYVFAFWPDSMDAFEFVAVTGADARVYEGPNADSPPRGVASRSVLRLKTWQGLGESGVAADSTWAQVDLPDGTTGWMRGVDVYSPVSWRAMFVKRGDSWIMVLFVAGD